MYTKYSPFWAKSYVKHQTTEIASTYNRVITIIVNRNGSNKLRFRQNNFLFYSFKRKKYQICINKHNFLF
jgi:hypothetical protein